MTGRSANLVGVGSKAEVFHGLSRVLGSTKKKSVGSGGRPKSQLIQGQCLTTGLLDPSPSSSSEAKSSDGQLGHCQEAVVIGDRSDNDDSLSLVRLSDVRDDTRERNRRAVDPRHKQATQHDFVEVGVRAT